MESSEEAAGEEKQRGNQKREGRRRGRE